MEPEVVQWLFDVFAQKTNSTGRRPNYEVQ